MKKVKKIPLVCFAILMALALLLQSTIPLCSAKAYASTDTDIEIPAGYKPVYTIADLAGINSNPSGKYILMNDIDMTEETSPGGSWDNGNGWTPLEDFSGVFDGNGYHIIGMHIYGEIEGKAALFSSIPRNYNNDNGNYEYNSNAIIKNLGILDCDIDITISNITHVGDDDTYVGGIVGHNGGIIQNCYVSGTIKATPNNYCMNMAGGIAGRNQGIITDCYNTADVYTPATDSLSSYAYAGGIAAVNSEKIKNCYNTGKITSSYDGNSGAVYARTYSYYDSYYASSNTNNYFLNTSVDNKHGMAGKSLTEAQMKLAASFTGFDFNNTWVINELCAYPYPQLKSCLQVKVSATSIKLSQSKIVLRKKERKALKAVVNPLDTTDTITWTSSNPKIVSVTQKGVIKAKKKGKATVTAETTSGKYASVKITVKK